MKLSSRARHAVRFALEVSRRSTPGKPVRIAEIARITGISQSFLAQLALALKSHSLLRGISGRHGGYVLARPANEITVSQVVTAVSGPLCLSVCTEELPLCLNGDSCECRLLWIVLQARMSQFLDDFTLADLSNKHRLDALRHEIQGVEREKYAAKKRHA